jgi:hypothetical protein
MRARPERLCDRALALGLLVPRPRSLSARLGAVGRPRKSKSCMALHGSGDAVANLSRSLGGGAAVTVSSYGTHDGVPSLYARSGVDRILCRTQHTNSRCSLAAVTMCHASVRRVRCPSCIRRCEKNPRLRKFVEMAYASDQNSAVNTRRSACGGAGAGSCQDDGY